MHISSSCVPLLRDNIDTDQIIPAKFLSITDKAWLGNHLFSARRYTDTGEPNPEFVLNDPTCTWSILLTGQNFWCWSSREHAAWAIKDYWFTAVIAVSFSDIFYANALNNNLLVVPLAEPAYSALVQVVSDDPTMLVTLDLADQTVTRWDHVASFQINPFKKYCLLTGKGNLEYILSHEEKIRAYESVHTS